MEAARTFRRVAEIKALMDERSEAMAMDTAESPWHDQALEPPAASMGNAVSWRPLTRADAPRATPRAVRPPGPSVNQGEGAAGAGEASGGRGAGLALRGGRRQAACSCCLQPRVIGHVRECAHTNRVCSRCRNEVVNTAL